MRILGIDPGCNVSGFGIMQKELRGTTLLDYGYLNLPQSKNLVVRVGLFYNFFREKIAQWQVSDIALEVPFLGKNTQSFLKLGYLRGIVYLLADQNGLVLHEFLPSEVKQAVTGFGGAKKEQVSRIILQLFPRLQLPEKLDVTDALAITLTGLWRKNQIIAPPASLRNASRKE